MFYVRKMGKDKNFSRIKYTSNIDDLGSDILKQEFSTRSNTLSFWKCENMENIETTIKAILLSSNKIEKCKMIFISSEIIESYGLDVEENKGKTGYKGFEQLHVDIKGLTYKKIGDMLKIYKDIFNMDEYAKDYTKDDVEYLIKEVYNEGKLDFDILDKSFVRDIKKILGLEISTDKIECPSCGKKFKL